MLLALFDVNKTLSRWSKSSLQLSYAYIVGNTIVLGLYASVMQLLHTRFGLVLESGEGYRDSGRCASTIEWL